MYFGKRFIDIILVLILLPIILPICLLVALVLFVTQGTPIFFQQARPGLYGNSFILVKFRTMRQEKVGINNEDADRLTRVGRFLRRWSLDELPELWNIIKGDMSFVGPRPLLLEYLPLYSEEQNRRHDVLPGITGWAQVNGRNVIPWEERLKLDVWYVENCSLWLDIKILLLTFASVVKGRGISQTGHVTVEKFRGN